MLRLLVLGIFLRFIFFSGSVAPVPFPLKLWTPLPLTVILIYVKLFACESVYV